MKTSISRRRLLKTATSAALLSSGGTTLTKGIATAAPATLTGRAKPNLALEITGKLAAAPFTETGMRRIKQLGVNHVIMGGPPIPWETSQIRGFVDQLKSRGLTLGNMMISGFPNAVYGRPGRDEEIAKVKQSIEAAGAAGVPVLEYNFYAHRLIEGYYEEQGRAGSGTTAFDFDRVRDLPPLPEEGVHSLEEMWNNIAYFLK